jgi:MFS family permease
VFGRIAGRRAHATRLLLVSLLAGAVLIVAMALARDVLAFTASRILLGLAVGGAPTLAYTIAGDHIPDTVRASTYALLSSTAMLGASLGPTMTGILSAANLRAPLWAGGATYLLLAAQTIALDRRRRSHARALAEART